MTQAPEDAVLPAPAVRATPRLTAAQVAEYLRSHPNFLARHPDVLESQTPPTHRNGGGIVDFQQFMVDKLRKDLARMRAEQDDLLANSRDNLSTQDRIHKAVLALLAARSFEHLIEIITTDLALLLDVDVVMLCIESTDSAPSRPRTEGLQLLEPGAVERLVGEGRTVLLRDDVKGDREVFGPGAGLVRSDALLRLSVSRKAPPSLIAFGTRHPGYFNPGQGTDLLSFLARILEHCIRGWLDLPE